MAIQTMKSSEMEALIKMRGWEVDVYAEPRSGPYGTRYKPTYQFRVVATGGEVMEPITLWHYTKITALRNAMRIIQDESTG